jgi:ABC-type polar amino acid transport system ATPase subunit
MERGMTETLSIRDLRVARDGRDILRGVSVDVAPGSICALMGRSGAGKSTVLRAAVALQSFDAGEITLGDVKLHAGPVPPESRLRALRHRIGMVFQMHALFEHLTAIDNITLAPVHALGVARESADASARELLDSLGIAHRAHALPRQLSGGEAQRVAIARSLALNPAMLLMDEPTAALDPARRNALAETLRSLAAQGRGLLIATHDVDFALACASEVVILAEGEIVERGPAREVLMRPRTEAARALLQHAGDG